MTDFAERKNTGNPVTPLVAALIPSVKSFIAMHKCDQQFTAPGDDGVNMLVLAAHQCHVRIQYYLNHFSFVFQLRDFHFGDEVNFSVDLYVQLRNAIANSSWPVIFLMAFDPWMHHFAFYSQL